MIGLGHYLTVAGVLFTLGILGIFLNRKNVIVILMCVELMLLAVNINLVAFSVYQSNIVGQIFAMLVLTVVCTLITFRLMNRWQPFVTATEAGLIYCAEPIWTSLMALTLPAWLGVVGGFIYQNERATSALLIGGALITAANVLIQFRPPVRPAAGR